MKKTLIYGFALALLFVPTSFAQMSGDGKPTMPDCKAMMQEHAAMEKHMAEMDAKLQTMVADMNKAKGSAKVDKAAAVITELVTQRTMTQKHMAEMKPKMMEHMMKHMKDGMMNGMSDSMSGCPMMKGGEKGTEPSAEHKH
jgi:hypothetical protein